MTDAELWNWSQQRSTILEHAGRWEEALAELRVMLGRGPAAGDERVRLVGRIAMALLKTFQPQEARKLLEAELQRDPQQLPLRAAAWTSPFRQIGDERLLQGRCRRAAPVRGHVPPQVRC